MKSYLLGVALGGISGAGIMHIYDHQHSLAQKSNYSIQKAPSVSDEQKECGQLEAKFIQECSKKTIDTLNNGSLNPIVEKRKEIAYCKDKELYCVANQPGNSKTRFHVEYK